MTFEMNFRKIPYQKYNAERKKQLRSDIFELMFQLSDKLTPEHIDFFFFNPKIKTYRYYEIRGTDNKMIAFFCGYYILVPVQGKMTHIYNSRISIAPEYQGKSIFRKTFSTMFRALGVKALLNEGYFVSNMVNPLSYYATVRTSHQAFPRHDSPLQPEMETIINAIGEINDYRLEKKNGVIKTVGGVSPNYTEQQMHRIRTTKNPDIRFLIDSEVDFSNGEGIMVVVPYSRYNIFKTLINSVFRKRNKS